MQGIDVNKLPLVGKGSYGAIYRLDDKRCIKVCKRSKHLQMEFRVLEHSKRFPHFPRVYECGDNYMIREYFDGPDAIEYIKKNGLTKDFAKKLIEIIDISKELGYAKLDCRLCHIIVVKDEELKIIDPTRHMDKKADYPVHMLRELKRLGYKKKFLKYVQECRPDYYRKWKNK